MLRGRLSHWLHALLFLKVTNAQNVKRYSNSPGQTSNVDIVEYTSLGACNRTNLTYYNASSSVVVDAFAVPQDVSGASVVGNLTSLTFIMGVVEGPYNRPPYENITFQQFWVTPTPYILLDSFELPYYGCSTIISSLTNQVNVRGQGDNGSCTTLFNQACVDALLTQAKNMALGWPGQDARDCSAMGNPPLECQQFGTAGGIKYLNLTWLSDGLGVYDSGGLRNDQNSSGGSSVTTIDWPQVLTICAIVWLGNPVPVNSEIGECEGTGALLLESSQGLHQNDTYNYDSFVTTVAPILTAVWLKEEHNPPWSDARLVCLRPDQFSAGSRVPPVPRLSGAASFNKRLKWHLFWTMCFFWVVALP
jgi:hypothetical protein